MFSKSRVLLVTNVADRERAIAAINASIDPVGRPIILSSD
jgi:hypothetical protein